MCGLLVLSMRQKAMAAANKILVQHYASPCGELLLGSVGDELCLCNWTGGRHHGRVDKRLQSLLQADYEMAPSAVTIEAARQLDEYFARRRTQFDVPLRFAGTPFQLRVWHALLEIPYGQTVSYGELARQIGVPSAVRAVANANGANAISIFAPCHRVVGSTGSLTGYGGGLAAKQFLIELEKWR